MKKLKSICLLFIVVSSQAFAQSDFEKVLKGGELLINGLSILRSSKSNASEEADTSGFIKNVCVKNKLEGKITIKLVGKDEDDNDVKKEMVVQPDGKECVFEIPKGIYTYEIILANKEVYKKGEYKITEDITLTVKPEE